MRELGFLMAPVASRANEILPQWQRPEINIALPHKRLSAECQKRTLIGSFDHLVGAGEQRRWHRNAERLRDLEIDRQLEFGWLHNG
jgi:hypothetical protein